MVMKAAQINQYRGGPIVEINQNTPKPLLSSGKVLVSIKSAGGCRYSQIVPHLFF